MRVTASKPSADSATDLNVSDSAAQSRQDILTQSSAVTMPALIERQVSQRALSTPQTPASSLPPPQGLSDSEPLFKQDQEKRPAPPSSMTQAQQLKAAIITRDIDTIGSLVDYADAEDEDGAYTYYPKYLMDIGPTLTEIAAQGQTEMLRTFLQIFERKMPERTLPLAEALTAAAQGGHGNTLSLLLGLLDPTVKSQYEQALNALRAALNVDSAAAARSVIDWLKEAGAFGADYVSSDRELTSSFSDDDSESLPLKEELPTLSDQKIGCLAKAGYIFSSDFFPWHCEDKTLVALQDIWFGKTLQHSPLSKVTHNSAGALEQVWACIAQCGQLNKDGQFDVQASRAKLMLLGFRQPVAVWLAEVLRSCSPSNTAGLPFQEILSDTQAHFFGLMLLAETPAPPLKSSTSDPLVSAQCASMAAVSAHMMQLNFDDAEQFFKKYLSCITDNFEINNTKLHLIFRTHLGLPNAVINQIHRAIEQCMDLPLTVSIKPGTTARQMKSAVLTQVRLGLVPHLIKILPERLASEACAADISSEVRRVGDAFTIYAERSIALIGKLCRQMQDMIESDQLDTLDLSETDDTTDSGSDSLSEDFSDTADPDETSKTDPDSSEG